MNSSVFRPADFIEAATRNIGWALLLGLLLVLLALAAFWFEWRRVLIGLVAIPVSYMAAALVLYATRATFNIVVLAGLLIGIGIVVDDAVVDVDHIARRLREAREAGDASPALRIILDASMEMRSAMVYAMLVLLLTVTPILFIGQTAGAFFQPLAIAYGLAILASMLVALTLTPALFLLLYAKAQPREEGSAPMARAVQRLYQNAVKPLLPRTGLLLLIAAILTVGAIAILPFLKVSLLPTFKERNIVVQLQGAPGMSQPEMSRISGRVSEELRAEPGIKDVSAQVGRAIFGDRIVDVNSADLLVSIDPAADYDMTVATIKSIVSGYPGLQYSVQTYLGQQSSSVMPAVGAPSFVVRVYGDADTALRASAEGVQKAIAGIPGIADARISYPVYAPTLEIEVNLAAAKHFGVKPGDVRRAAATMFSGIQVGSLFEEQKVFDVVVWSTPETRHSISDVLNLQVDTPSGGHVRLGDVAQVRVTSVPVTIKHEAVHRYMDINISVQGRSVGAVAAQVQSELQRIQFPLEYHAEILGDLANRQGTVRRISFMAIAALMGVFLLLQSSYKSWRLAFVALITVPMALSGGIAAVLLTGGELSLGSLAGMLLLVGSVIRNGIVMTNHFYRLAGPRGEKPGIDMILEGATRRVVPVFLSAVAVCLAFLPALFLGDIPGLEIIRPMAIVVIGGSITTLILNLVVLPAFFLRYGFGREAELEMVPATAAAD